MTEAPEGGDNPCGETVDRDTEPFYENRIATTGNLFDFLEKIRNLVGIRLYGYEELIKEHTDELMAEIQGDYDIDWFRVDVDQVAAGAFAISVYGEGVPLDGEE